MFKWNSSRNTKTGDKKLKVTLPEVEGYTVEYNGTDLNKSLMKI